MKQIKIVSRLQKSIVFIALTGLTIYIFSCSSFRKTNPDHPVSGKIWNLPLNRTTTIPMAWIKPGAFTMGSPENEPGRKPDESPQTSVTLSRGYWIGTTELTIGQWKAVTGQSIRQKADQLLNDEKLYDFNGKQQKIRDFMGFDRNQPENIMANEDDRLPMYFASWNEAMAFCKKLTQMERANGRLPSGYEYNLPTEAQWEFACRGSGGSVAKNLDDVAWYVQNSADGYTGKGFGSPARGPRDVAKKAPNAFGLYDTLGNLWEWCRDWYGPYPGGTVTDPLGPATGAFKVNRGGSFGSGKNDERCANRAQNPPNEPSAYRGFRIALCPVQ
jgi:formylglycine-generating enzyme required for sulfatase activity